MAADPDIDDEPEWSDEELAELQGEDPDGPKSNQRDKRRATGLVQLLLARLDADAKELSGDALAEAIDSTLDRIVEHHLNAVPRAARPELRVILREALENDPTLAPLVHILRTAKA